MRKREVKVGVAYTATKGVPGSYSLYLKEGDTVYVQHIGYNGLQLTNDMQSKPHTCDGEGNYNLFYDYRPWRYLK